MRVLLVHPRFPVTYWGFQHGLRVVGKSASLPPLGLVTLAACLPGHWHLRLVDLNLGPLSDADLDWADVVLTGGMLVQVDSALDVVRRAHARSRFVVVGGPAPTTCPELFEAADLRFRGEVEERAGELVHAIETRWTGTLAAPPGWFPDVARAPLPRFDLLQVGRYASMSVQYSRGCPYRCEFCDVIEIFGRRPRVKAPEQVLRELDSLYALGYRGSVFFVDDNFIGNRPAVRELLPRIRDWQIDHGRPFEFYTEASVNLAADPELTRAMVEAGFSSVFLGIETPSTEALRSANKHQNLKLDLREAVETLTRAGLECMGGFIVGFDHDTPECFDAQREFILGSPLPLAMVGVLTALPGTALWKRLEREGRLRERSGGDQFGRPNFEPVMDEQRLLRGYAALMRDVYSPEAYYARGRRYLDLAGPRPPTGPRNGELLSAARVFARLGVASPRRAHFWRLVARAAGRDPSTLRWAVAHAVMGEHLIRYTREQVVPRVLAAASNSASRPPPASWPLGRPWPSVHRPAVRTCPPATSR